MNDSTLWSPETARTLRPIARPMMQPCSLPLHVAAADAPDCKWHALRDNAKPFPELREVVHEQPAAANDDQIARPGLLQARKRLRNEWFITKIFRDRPWTEQLLNRARREPVAD